MKINSCILGIILLMLPFFSFSQEAPEISANRGFEENKGQIFDESGKFRDDVFFVAKFSGANVFFTNEGVVFYFYKIQPSKFDEIRAGKVANPYTDKEWEDIMKKMSEGNYNDDLVKTKAEFYRIDINFPGASLIKAAGENEQLEKRSFFNPKHPEGIQNVPVYDKIRYKNVYPGIDLVFYIQSGKLKYDFELAANANPNLIKILYKGHESINIDEKGNAVVNILPGKMIEKAPESFQDGVRVDSKFTVDNDTIRFQLGQYDRSKAVTIDPGLVWSTYFYDGSATAAAFTYTNPSWDSNGNMYIVLNTYNNTNFPMVNPGGSVYYQPTAGDNGLQLVIMKFNTSKQIVWSTYYAGSQTANAKFTNQCLAIDQSDNIYIIGSVFYVYALPTAAFPTYNPGGTAYYETEQGNNRNFILKFSSTGVRLWATMFNKTSGSSSSGLELCGITIDASNRLVMTGETYTPPSWNPMPLVNPGGSYYYRGTAVESSVPTLHRFNTSLALEWSTYITQGTAGKYNGNYSSVAVDASNNVFLASSGSGPYTTVNPGGAYVDGTAVTNGRKFSIFKFVSSGALNWCTLYGGDFNSAGSMLWQDPRDLKVASNGDVVIVGRGNANNFPTYATGSAYLQSTLSTGSSSVCDGVILQFSNTGVRKWATYYGANGTSDGTDFWGLGIDASDNITVSGISRTTTFPTLVKAGSYNQATQTGSYAVVFAQFDNAGVRQWASYFGNQTWWSSGGFGLKTQACGTKFVQCGTVDNAYSITTVNPGGGAYFQSSKEGATGSTDFMCELFDEAAGANSTAASSITGTTTICASASTTLSVSGGTLGAGGAWHWYTGSCGGTPAGTGASITVSPGVNTTYYVRAEGTCNTTGCVSVPVNITPNASIASVTGTSPICIGATANYAANSVVLGGGSGAWSSSNNSIASVNGSGVVTGNTAGGCNIIYTISGGCGGTVSQQQAITITPNASIASVSGTSPICIGATANYAANSAVLGGGSGVWSSSNNSIASVNGSGVVTGNAAGGCNIIYTISGGCGGTVSQQQAITVNPNASIASVSGTSPICIGATANYAANSAVLGGGSGAWSSSNNAIASVNGSGVVIGNAAGGCNIIYTISGGCGGTVSQQQAITITPNASIASVSGTSPICIGATANYAANSAVLGGGSGVWSSSNNAIASVNGSGVVTGNAAGGCNIIYTISGGCGGTVSQQQGITVTPNASIASVTGTSPICIGATANYAANSAVLGGGSGVWSSSNNSIATVNGSGVVTGNSAGGCNIIYTISGGCGGTVSQQQAITINPNASITSVTGTSPICPGATTNYSANGIVLGGSGGIRSLE